MDNSVNRAKVMDYLNSIKVYSFAEIVNLTNKIFKGETGEIDERIINDVKKILRISNFTHINKSNIDKNVIFDISKNGIKVIKGVEA